MSRRPYDLPPLTALAAFEAAARRGSMKLAAADLNVTPGAVSRQVKALEDDLGRPLFTRIHRGVELTEEGRDLADALAQGFARVADSCRRLRSLSGFDSVTVAATTAFAGFWLIPRVGAFWQAHPEITVNHAISDERIEFRRGDIDMALRYGDGDWRGESALRLFGDRLYPVCAPSFLRARGAIAASDLTRLPLLRISGVDPAWIDWDRFLEWAGLPEPGSDSGGRRLNNYTVLIQACRDGQGVALGWHRLIAPLVARGDLVRVTDLAMTAPGAHYVTWDANRSLSPAMTALRDWLQTQTGGHD